MTEVRNLEQKKEREKRSPLEKNKGKIKSSVSLTLSDLINVQVNNSNNECIKWLTYY